MALITGKGAAIHIMHTMISLTRKLFLFTVASVFLISSMSSVSAISQNDRDNIYAPFYDDCAPEEPPAGITSIGDIKSVFMVGDSITYTASLSPHDMKQKFQEKGIEATIKGSAGGTIEDAGSEGDPNSALEAIDEYKADVEGAGAVVVAHGTNHQVSSFKNSIKKMVDKIRSVNESAVIFWVNTYTKGSGIYSESASIQKNRDIRELASEKGYQVINVTNTQPKIKLHYSGADFGIHPEYDESGIGRWRDAVIADVSGEKSGAAPVEEEDLSSESAPIAEVCCPNGGGGVGDDSAVEIVDDSIYKSDLEEPFILEQWAIHVLKAIAQKRGISEDKTVTENHVIALVAFALGEGGDINNTSSKFNPLNTGLYAPELLEGDGAVDGTQSFKSFDAGVEGTARTMLGSNQNRLAKILSDPNSTPKDFMKALTYFNRYPGNKFWAAASLPPNQDSYFLERLSLITTVRNDYKDIASLVIGTDALEQPEGIRDKSKLSFEGKGSGGSEDVLSGGTENCACSVERNPFESEALVGENNQEKVFNFFLKNELTPEQSAGIVGNFVAESGDGIDPAATNGTHNGIAQWDEGRWGSLVEFAGDRSPRDLLVQLEFALQEDAMKEYIGNKYNSPEDAARGFEAIFERSGGSALDKRMSKARAAFNKYKDNRIEESEACTSGDAGALVVDGYAFPVWITKKSDYGTPGMSQLPCPGICHHDGTPALDLGTKYKNPSSSEGAPVYAISDGVLTRVNHDDVRGSGEVCNSVTLTSSKDNHIYWYGHLKRDTSVRTGQRVKAGDKIGNVGNIHCADDTVPHLHISRVPPGSSPDSLSSRDRGLITIINKLYEKVPN